MRSRPELADKALAYIRRHGLIRPGDRVAVAVSGGADSVALLRLLLELREELGIVVCVAHFNHQIRGAEADADEAFVCHLAGTHVLDFQCESGDAPGFARVHKLSLEAAGRRLRYEFFRRLLKTDAGGGASAAARRAVANKVATAHTLDDQAETVLLRLLRGAGTRGLAGIFPELPESGQRSAVSRQEESQQPSAVSPQLSAVGDQEVPRDGGAIVRPLLGIRRMELEQYLRAIGQEWREDASNRDLHHTRNRVRHVLLPLLEREFNPAIREVLADTAEVARGEEDFWERLAEQVATRLAPSPKPAALDVAALAQQHVAVQRRLVRRTAQAAGVHLDLKHVEAVLELALAKSGNKVLELPGGGRALLSRSGQAGFDLRFENASSRRRPPKGHYEYRLSIPGEVDIRETGTRLRLTLVPVGGAEPGYNQVQLLDPGLLEKELVLRNWRPGDRFLPAHSKSPKKIKELLQQGHVPPLERARWPVLVSGGTLVWVRGWSVAAGFAPKGRHGVLVEEQPWVCE